MKQPYPTFEAYLEGELSEGERTEFENRLQTDPLLKKQFEAFAALRQGFRDSIANEDADAKLNQTLSGLGREFFPPARKRWSFRRVWLPVSGLAAACALLLFLFYKPKDLFRQYYQAPLAAFTEKGSGQDGFYQEAERAFNAGDYRRAAQYLDSILSENPGALQATFYRGLCHLETDNPPAARGMLEPLATGASAFAEDARWFLALSYLKEKDYAACLAELANIPQGSRWGEKAEALKLELNRLR